MSNNRIISYTEKKLYEFSLEAKTWTEIEAKGTPPIDRNGQYFFIYENKLI